MRNLIKYAMLVGMPELFYRVHWDGCPEFSAANAYSAPWGSERSEDGSQTECHRCIGTGNDDMTGACALCDSTGWEDAVPGYSCVRSPEELIAYMNEHGVMNNDDTVIVFEGRQVDTGFDGEPTAIPERIIETLPWSEFTARHAAQETSSCS